MDRPLDNHTIEWWEPWQVLFLYLGFLSLFWFGQILDRTFLALIYQFSVDQFLVLALLVPLAYCFWKYGAFQLKELLPCQKDYITLVIALMIDFWAFGLLVGRENVGWDKELQGLSGYPFWENVLTVTLIGPFLEELLFRRYLGEIFAALYSPISAFFLIVVISTSFHLHPDITGVEIFWHIFAQSLLTAAYFKSRLGVSFIIHGFHNTISTVLSL